jgi:lactate dehydrogenase-like 2-hydroxyacid dehydrogenase
MRQNKQIEELEEGNRETEKYIREPYFSKIVVTDPIILFPDQWERLRSLSKEIIAAGEQTSIDELWEHAEQEKKPVCWTQLAARPYEGKELEERVRDADAIIACWTNIHDKVLEESSNLEYIGYWTNLAAHRINLDKARERGIHVDYVPDYGTQAVASQTLTGILAVLRNLPAEISMTKKGKWYFELLKTRERVPLTEDQIPQSDLWYKKVGIVGFGPIAKQVSKLLSAYETDIKYWSRKRRRQETERELGVEYADLEHIFSESDIVSVHLNPYAGDKLISRELIYSMKPGSVFANTSAGGLVDQEALFERLHSGEIRAYLDVYDGLPPKSEIRELSSKGNIFTYRAGWFTKDAVRLKGEKFLRNMEKYIVSKGGLIE